MFDFLRNAPAAPAKPEAETVVTQTMNLDQLLAAYRIARSAQISFSKRAAALQADHPLLWRAYFTNAGEAERKAERKANE